jgi:hypothetical protein
VTIGAPNLYSLKYFMHLDLMREEFGFHRSRQGFVDIQAITLKLNIFLITVSTERSKYISLFAVIWR